MPCMAGLPDGTYLILNGGQHGVAGFGLGGSPNYNAVLYDPSKPVNSRMSIMANTTVAVSAFPVVFDGNYQILIAFQNVSQYTEYMTNFTSVSTILKLLSYSTDAF